MSGKQEPTAPFSAGGADVDLLWGCFGSETARFRSFVASPAAALHHLRHLFRRQPDTQVGHNAAGGWIVLLLLVLALFAVAAAIVAALATYL